MKPKKMKISKLLVFVAVGSGLFISACKKKTETPTPTTTNNTTTPADTAYMFTYKVDGTVYNPTGYKAQYYNSNSMQGIYINNYTNGSTISPIDLRIENRDTVGTYPLGLSVTADYNPTLNNDFFGTSGTIVISKIADGKISGTFSFVGEHSGVTHTITDGVFKNVPY